jgi:hypothetical protein
MKWKFWLTDDLTLEEVQTKAEISYVAYKKAQTEHKELGECITKLREHQETLCPYIGSNVYSYSGILYHNNELHVAIEDRIRKIVALQIAIKI